MPLLGWEKVNGGYRRMNGTRMPPSDVNVLYSLPGAVPACAQRGPYQTYESFRPILSYELL